MQLGSFIRMREKYGKTEINLLMPKVMIVITLNFSRFILFLLLLSLHLCFTLYSFLFFILSLNVALANPAKSLDFLLSYCPFLFKYLFVYFSARFNTLNRLTSHFLFALVFLYFYLEKLSGKF